MSSVSSHHFNWCWLISWNPRNDIHWNLLSSINVPYCQLPWAVSPQIYFFFITAVFLCDIHNRWPIAHSARYDMYMLFSDLDQQINGESEVYSKFITRSLLDLVRRSSKTTLWAPRYAGLLTPFYFLDKQMLIQGLVFYLFSEILLSDFQRTYGLLSCAANLSLYMSLPANTPIG